MLQKVQKIKYLMYLQLGCTKQTKKTFFAKSRRNSRNVRRGLKIGLKNCFFYKDFDEKHVGTM